MQTQDKTKFTNLLVGMKELYGEVILESQIDFYWEVFKNFELKDLRQAFKWHIQNLGDGDHFPKLRTLLQFIEHNIKAGQAWLIAQGAFRKVARYETIYFNRSHYPARVGRNGRLSKTTSRCVKRNPFLCN
jgi:hypothetical protein